VITLITHRRFDDEPNGTGEEKSEKRAVTERGHESCRIVGRQEFVAEALNRGWQRSEMRQPMSLAP
jgi:hypothetical protein